jgi:hypothetical protein
LAWLNATPRKAEGDKSEIPEKSRREWFEANGHELVLPPCYVQHLVRYLFEIGPAVAGNTITHGEIESWQHNTGIGLSAWEASTLRKASSEYLKQSHDATARSCPAPYSNETLVQQNRTVVSSKFRSFIDNSKVTRA